MKGSKLDKRPWGRIVTATSVLAFSFLIMGSGAFAYGGGVDPAYTSGTSYGGSAYGVASYVPWFGGTTYAYSGSLPAQGGFLVADFAPVSTGVAAANVFLSYTSGFTDVAMSEAATSDIVLLGGTAFQVVAGFAYARSVATCQGMSAASQVFDLTVGGVPIAVTGTPNQAYSVPGVLSLIVNEQTFSYYGGAQSVTVNALHGWVSGVEFVVSSATSTIACGQTSSLLPLGGSPSTMRALATSGGEVVPMCGYPDCDKEVPNDFVTGGGFFVPPNSNRPGRVNFGFNAGPRSPNNPELKGHLNLIDHVSRDHVQGVTVDFYYRFSGDPDHCRIFGGDATFNKVPGYRYNTGVCDYGEPGRYDRFAIEVTFNGLLVYRADNGRSFCPSDRPICGELDGGNIQLHRMKA